MSESIEQLIKMARAAEKDERLSDGALLGKLARALTLQNSALDKLIIIIRNRDQSEYDAKILGFAKQILRSEIDWTDDAALSSTECAPSEIVEGSQSVGNLSEFQRRLDSVTEEQAREYVRKERERNANRDKPIPAPRDGFINDYD